MLHENYDPVCPPIYFKLLNVFRCNLHISDGLFYHERNTLTFHFLELVDPERTPFSLADFEELGPALKFNLFINLNLISCADFEEFESCLLIKVVYWWQLSIDLLMKVVY